MGLILCQSGLVGFGLPVINKFMFGLWVRGLAERSWKGIGFGIWPTEGTGLRGLWVWDGLFHAKYYDCHRYAVNELLSWYINYLGKLHIWSLAFTLCRFGL